MGRKIQLGCVATGSILALFYGLGVACAVTACINGVLLCLSGGLAAYRPNTLAFFSWVLVMTPLTWKAINREAAEPPSTHITDPAVVAEFAGLRAEMADHRSVTDERATAQS